MTKRNTSGSNERSLRFVALRDLRFAGTVAAGLVVAILAVGALAAPMVGWRDWPSSNAPGTSDGALTLSAPAPRTAAMRPNSPFSGIRAGGAVALATDPLALAGGPLAFAP